MNGTPDAVVVGAGPNGLAAALRLAAAGLRVQVFELADTPGGGVRSEELTLPGFVQTCPPRRTRWRPHRRSSASSTSPVTVCACASRRSSTRTRSTAGAPRWPCRWWRRRLPGSGRTPAPTRPVTGGFGLLQGMLAHHVGWPLVEGGSQKLADAMVAALKQQGGEVVTGHEVTDLREFEGVPAVLLDVTPRALVRMAGDRLNEGYRKWVARYRYGPGVFKLDWALSDLVPWTHPDVRRAGTVHLGGTLEEMVAAEAATAAGRPAERPFVLTVQPTVVDPVRAPAGRHVLWGYTHVPHGSDVDMTERVEV